jgi:ComF family protein
MINSQFSIKEIKNYLLDILFPKSCVNCGHEGEVVCFDCLKKIVPVVSQVCPECGRLSQRGKYHVICGKGKALKGVIASAYFEEGPIREMIHNFKYNGVTPLGEVLADLMSKSLARKFQFPIANFQSIPNSKLKNFQIENSLKTENCKIENYALTYVPLHWRRQARRGYNQAEILARQIGNKLGLKVEDLLTKARSTKRQVELQGNSRRKNLSGVFEFKAGICIKNKTIIVVDDITTTGSTLNECAAVLKNAGAKEVWGLVVARG